jgi:D-aspartate ligase
MAEPSLRAGKDWPPAVVASVFQTGLNLMRDLERKGVRVVGVDYEPINPGFVSVYGKSFHCPNPDTHPAEWLAFMQELAGRFATRPVLIAAADIFVSAMARHADALEKHYVFSRETIAVQGALATKEQQYALAARYGLPCPRSAYVTSAADVAAFAAAATFPCLLKPRHQREWDGLPEGHTLRGRKVVVAEDASGLQQYYGLIEKLRPEVVAQEVIVGPDDAKYCYLSVYGRGGGRLGSCVVREFYAHPLYFGSASSVQPVVDPNIHESCDAFLRATGYVGICEIEVKRDTRDGTVRLIEINPRYSVTADSAIYAGIEIGWLHYLDLIGRRPAAAAPTRFDFRHIVLRRHVPVLTRLHREGLITWREALRSFRPPVVFWDFDLRDWRVTGRTLNYCARVLARWMLGRR